MEEQPMARPGTLVADDVPAVRSAPRKRLSSLGDEVSEASDGLAVLHDGHVEWAGVIILDHETPDADGRSVARVLRSRCDAPIVFLSGHRKEDFRSIVAELRDVYKPLGRFSETPSALPERGFPQ